MMALVWVLLSLAFLFGWFGRREIALAFIALCFAVAVKLFLWEIHSPTYGYRMPWIQTQHIETPPAPQQRAETAEIGGQA
ncbi:hypothetical protein [Brucella sp. IR073]|uniref:hypothetical protein n=1 Tax=unclassified Brucella TaxID=2632610 RepID=UPI003B97E74C